jgi:1,4-alpha-glucan branching enzyme
VNPAGFEWISHGDAEQSVVSFVRWSKFGQAVVVICNFTPITRHDYRVGMPTAGEWIEIFNTDNGVYGGSGVSSRATATQAVGSHQYVQSLALTLPPLSCVMLALSENKG